jgi:hypothetical protein
MTLNNSMSITRRVCRVRRGENMGHFSMEKSRSAGSILNGNQQGIEVARRLGASVGIPSLFATGQVEFARKNADAAIGVLAKARAFRGVLIEDGLPRGVFGNRNAVSELSAHFMWERYERHGRVRGRGTPQNIDWECWAG